MISLRVLLFAALALVGGGFSGVWWTSLRRALQAPPDDADLRVGWPRPAHLAIGFVTDFLDTLGVGSFAVTTSLYRVLRLVPDRLIPGTMLVGHALPTLVQAFIYVQIVEVETVTLVVLVAGAVAGAWLGAGVAAGFSRRRMQLGMGIALLAAAAIISLKAFGVLPPGGDALGLSGERLFIGVAGNFVLGALMTVGIGAYAPSLILFCLLGMNARAVFPVMMSSCAFIMTVPSLRFVARGSYAPRPALGLTLAGVPGVLLAAFIVKELSLTYLNWLVVVVVVYTAISMLNSALRDNNVVAKADAQ